MEKELAFPCWKTCTREFGFKDNTRILDVYLPLASQSNQKNDNVYRIFLWNRGCQQSNSRNLASQSSLCCSKTLGGLGIMDLQEFNKSLLLKWWDKLLNDPPHPWNHLVTICYCNTMVSPAMPPLIKDKSLPFLEEHPQSRQLVLLLYFSLDKEQKQDFVLGRRLGNRNELQINLSHPSFGSHQIGHAVLQHSRAKQA